MATRTQEQEWPTGEDEAVVTLHPRPEDLGLRLDRYLTNQFPDLSRSALQRVIAAGGVSVDGVERRQTFRVTPGQEIAVRFPEPEPPELLPEPMTLDIVYEDSDILVLNKPAGLVVHPGPGHASGTLVHGLLHHLPGLTIGGINRPGIVHRLDKDTSGLMVIATSDVGHAALLAQWAARSVEKRYIALAAGDIEVNAGDIDVPVARHPADRQRMAPLASGRPAVTRFEVLERFGEATLVELDLVTGRTHQIRVHLAFIGYPVVGDATYNRAAGRFGGTGAIVPRQFLHASRLTLELPSTSRRITFEAPLPDDLARALLDLGSRFVEEGTRG
jgi:23S rRNA pseudouridine1911/1915/1917 synthase